MATTDRAVVVGIDRYPGFDDLDGPENDATDFAAWLRDPKGGDITDDRITLILSSQFPVATDPLEAQPTTEAVIGALACLDEQGRACRTGTLGRRLYIFMAGHGFAPNVNTAALLMANAGVGRLGLHVPAALYADFFRVAGYFGEVVLLMDCCRDNLPGAPVQTVAWPPTVSPKISRRFYGFATTFTRRAREEPGAGGRVNGVFTRTVLAGLRGEAADPVSGLVTGDSLKRYVFNVRGAAVPAQSRQDPDFQYESEEDIIWTEGTAPAFTVRASITPTSAGKQVQLLDGLLAPVPPSVTAADAVEWAGLHAGLYEVDVAGGPSQALKLIGAGRTIDVSV